MRVHSLPESKRYPDTEDEWAIVLDRYNTVLDELFAGLDVYVATSNWSGTPVPPERPHEQTRWHPDAHRHPRPLRLAQHCHASQLDSSIAGRLPPAEFAEAFGVEDFVRARDTTGSPVPETDVFAGLGRSAVAPSTS